jgi:hypothetical protein
MALSRGDLCTDLGVDELGPVNARCPQDLVSLGVKPLDHSRSGTEEVAELAFASCRPVHVRAPSIARAREFTPDTFAVLGELLDRADCLIEVNPVAKQHGACQH